MMQSLGWLNFAVPLVLCAITQAKIHHLFSSNRNVTAAIHSIEFDDEANTLKLVKSIQADSTYLWMSFNHDKKSIYANSLQDQRIASYQIVDPATVKLSSTIPIPGGGQYTAFSVASSHEPYLVYTGQFPGPNSTGMAISTKSEGSLSDIASTWPYANETGVHGMALVSQNGTDLLFTADLYGNGVFMHRIDATGKAELLTHLTISHPGAGPRHLAVHPNLQWVYVVLEEDNVICAMKLQSSNIQSENNITYPLIPATEDKARYWSGSVMLSRSNRYLWVTARGRPQQNGTSQVSCFLLDDTGAIVKHLFMLPAGVAGQGSASNAIMPAPWSDEYAIYSDTPGGYVEMLKLDGRKETGLGVEFATAKAVARLEINPGACCANAIWYD